MPSLSSISAVVVIAVGLAGAWGHAMTERSQHDGPMLPMAALAWAQINCMPDLSERPGTPRVQAEDLMRVAAFYDSERRSHGLEHACSLAQRASQSVAANTPMSPTTHLLSILASLR